MTVEIIGGTQQPAAAQSDVLQQIISLAKISLGISASSTAQETAVVTQAARASWDAIAQFIRYDPVLKQRTEMLPVLDTQSGNVPGIWEVGSQKAYIRRQGSGAASGLQLSAIPVRSAPAIAVWISSDGRFGTADGSFASGDLKTEGSDFWAQYDTIDSGGDAICNDGILRSHGLWSAEPGSIKVVYTAGYTYDEMVGDDAAISAVAIVDSAVDETLRRSKKALALWSKNSRTGHNAGTITSENLGDYSYSLSGGVLDKLLLGGGLSQESKEKLGPFVLWGLDR